MTCHLLILHYNYLISKNYYYFICRLNKSLCPLLWSRNPKGGKEKGEGKIHKIRLALFLIKKPSGRRRIVLPLRNLETGSKSTSRTWRGKTGISKLSSADARNAPWLTNRSLNPNIFTRKRSKFPLWRREKSRRKLQLSEVLQLGTQNKFSSGRKIQVLQI